MKLNNFFTMFAAVVSVALLYILAAMVCLAPILIIIFCDVRESMTKWGLLLLEFVTLPLGVGLWLIFNRDSRK